MSDSDNYHGDEDLEDFVVSDEEIAGETGNPEIGPDTLDPDVPHIDRLAQLNAITKTHESYTSKVLRAHISVLVSALGGPDHSTPEKLYKLGHDALACLKDLKRWLRSVDERNGTYDVALACAECGLVTNDLSVILCQWDKVPKGTHRSKSHTKIMLACLELLVLLTWPVDVNRKTLRKDYTHKSNARRAQLIYKQHLLTYKDGKTLKAVIRLGLDALQMDRDEREPRDNNILRLILYLVRNLLYIEPPPAVKAPKAITNSSDLPNGVSAEDISLASVLLAFDRNHVLIFLTSIAHSVLSNIQDEMFGSLVMECISLLTRTVEPGFYRRSVPLGTSETVTVPSAASAAGLHLQDLLKEEEKRKLVQTNSVSTRHGRFGTLLSIRMPNNSSQYTISGQEALASTHDTLEKLDRTKKWHKPLDFKYDSNDFVSKRSSFLPRSSAHILKKFVDDLLTSGSFNNLVQFNGHHLTSLSGDRSLGRGGILEAVDPHELASYFMTTAWFFSYKRERNALFEQKFLRPQHDEDGLDYGSVGAALSEVNFILLISYFRSAYESRDRDSLHVAMLSMIEMLLISHSIFSRKRTILIEREEDIDEDRELAEGIIRKLFSQKQFLDVLVNVPKQAWKHSPEYLSVVVSMVHIVLRCFETLANEDVKLYIKTRRKMSKFNRATGLNSEMDKQHWHLIDRGSDEEEDESEIRYITQERKLDFKNIEVRFFHSDTVTAHIAYLARFEDLSHDEIKRGLTFFHRLFAVRKDYASLYRLDFMTVLYKLRAYLPAASNIRIHVEKFLIYFMKKFKSAYSRFPIPIELLFPRIENLEYKGYLSVGDLEVFSNVEGSSKSLDLPRSSYFDEDAAQPRAAIPLQFNDPEKDLDSKFATLIYHLRKKKNALKAVQFLATEIGRIISFFEKGVQFISLRLNLAQRRMLINDAYFRLLVETVGFELPFLQNDDTQLRQGVSKQHLESCKSSIQKWLELHEKGVGDIEPFLDQVTQQIFSSQQLEFGEIALESLRAALPVDEARAAELGLDDISLQKVIGLAKRKEYDEKLASKYFEELEEEESQAIEHSSQEPRRKRRARDAESLSLDANFEDQPSQRRSRRKPVLDDSDDESQERRTTKSSEMVHDSDDESDSEEIQKFFERENKLRELISKEGGIKDKEQLEQFKSSWQHLIGASPEAHVKRAVSRSAHLFVELDDDENSEESIRSETPLTAGSEPDTQKAYVHTRKRLKVVLDDDDD